jgi:hypothetical protein
MIQRRLCLIGKAELNCRQDHDDQQRQGNRRFDDRSTPLSPRAAFGSSHIHVTLASLHC